MSDLLKKTDIEQAKDEIEHRRAAILRRHAEETQTLDSDRVELEILNHLIDIFTLKFKKPQILSPQPAPAPVVREKVPAPAAVNHEKVPAPAPIVHEPIVHEKAPAPAAVVHEKVSAKPVDVGHARSPRPANLIPGPTVKAADHVRGVKAHGSIPVMTHKEARFSAKDSGAGAAREARHHGRHKYPRTNFEAFARAVARELALD